MFFTASGKFTTIGRAASVLVFTDDRNHLEIVFPKGVNTSVLKQQYVFEYLVQYFKIKSSKYAKKRFKKLKKRKKTRGIPKKVANRSFYYTRSIEKIVYSSTFHSYLSLRYFDLDFHKVIPINMHNKEKLFAKVEPLFRALVHEAFLRAKKDSKNTFMFNFIVKHSGKGKGVKDNSELKNKENVVVRTGYSGLRTEALDIKVLNSEFDLFINKYLSDMVLYLKRSVMPNYYLTGLAVENLISKIKKVD